MNAPVRAWVGLGGNVGDAAATLRAALPALDALPATRLLRASRLFRTPAWGLTDQPDFVNAVAELETALSPRDLLDGLLAVERAFGRERRERWGPRTLDLDLLLHGDVALDDPGLHLPHPHLHERAFVLLPLAELAPGLAIPGHGRVADLLVAIDTTGCVPLSG
ncbi:MAG TPA: 2-amino-4-hydroxy-6-hydroxymethyldihydropteridine diphosphokinase [Xanthomonadaceae bacterium]|nr:2-amino-4-hydroxy-6-hydroxymethyldihydropteridine diphosphokinase [Xanthomonadaceae bacterium]